MGLLDDLKKIKVDFDLPVVSTVSKVATGAIASISQSTTPNKLEVTVNKPATVWERIGCSNKTLEFIKISLDDGVIDAKERAMLIRRAEEDGVDPQEFDFVMTKALEEYVKIAKNVITDMSVFFKTADAMANGAVKPDNKLLTSKMPGVLAESNPYLIASMGVVEAVATTISTFIKAPSKLNTFKAEIIRTINIPLLPEVLIDFFGYVNNQIIEETQRNHGKGIFTNVSESLFGKDIDLVPIWREKMKHVMTKAVMRYGNHPEVMGLLEKWRISPLKKLQKISDSIQIENFPIPQNASDYIALVKYSYEKGESIKTPNREAYAHLNSRLLKEQKRFVNLHPSVERIITENKVRTVNIVMSNCDNPVFMVELKLPEDLTDLLEVLHFLSTRKDLKMHHNRLYDEALRVFGSDAEAITKIRQFKPKNLFGF
ncbi:MAG: hypothetical protein K2J42_00135 [Muribaculaceae bacterium]|nr:hypothetical protein [Muribaculaceae bacterium]